MIEIGRAMKRIHLAFRRNGDKMLEKYGLTMPQMSLMLFLFRKADAGERVIQRDIEEALNLKTSTVSGTLDRLEKNGFICRVSEPDNRRVHRIEMTEKAFGMKEEGKKDIREFEENLLSPLSGEEQAKLQEMLQRILENLPQDAK